MKRAVRFALPLLAALLAPTYAALARDPRVPAGVDPGGPAIALIGPGIDYTLAGIAPRLARDGEGEPIGRDFLDGDATPFSRDAPTGVPETTDLVRRWPKDQPGRFVVIRATPDDLPALARAVSFAAQSPARIVLLPVSAMNGPAGALVREAGVRFRRVLFVVGLIEETELAPPRISTETIRSDNLLFVSVAVDAKAEPHLAELLVEPTDLAAEKTPAARLQAAIAGALSTAACLAQADAAATPAAIKQRLLALADPQRATGGRRLLVPQCPKAAP
jgi:hypothetical protein